MRELGNSAPRRTTCSLYLEKRGIHLDADSLLTAVTQTSKNLNLRCISPHQTGSRRSERRNPLLRKGEGNIQLHKDRQGGCVRAGHLNRERTLNFVLRRCGFDHRERSIHGELGNSPHGERHAACIWKSEAFTKSLDVVPRALFNRRHQFAPSPAEGCIFAILPSALNTLTDRRRAVTREKITWGCTRPRRAALIIAAAAIVSKCEGRIAAVLLKATRGARTRRSDNAMPCRFF